MTRITLATALTLAVLLLCGSPSQIQAQSDTKIVIKDGGSLCCGREVWMQARLGSSAGQKCGTGTRKAC